VAYFLLFLSTAGILTSTIFTMMAFVATWKYLTARSRRRRQALGFTRPVSILKPLHGSPAHLEECLEGYFKLDYHEYELIFCARREDDAGLAVARKLAARYPHIPVTILTSGEPPWMNARCYSMHLMAEAARQGDEPVHAAIANAARLIGTGIANAITITGIERVVLVGGLTGLGDLLLAPIRAEVRDRIHMFPSDGIEISFSELGDEVAVLGGIALAAQRDAESQRQ